jgi:transcriptional regulator GlxA family with amidase domain
LIPSESKDWILLTNSAGSRFVDAGVSAFGTRIITSGGISSGLDASLHVVEIRTSLEMARRVEDMLEYKWRRDEGVIVKP